MRCRGSSEASTSKKVVGRWVSRSIGMWGIEGNEVEEENKEKGKEDRV